MAVVSAAPAVAPLADENSLTAAVRHQLPVQLLCAILQQTQAIVAPESDQKAQSAAAPPLPPAAAAETEAALGTAIVSHLVVVLEPD